jgi:hypothetical protein
MDKISLDEFKKEINQIREYLKHIQYVNNILDYNVLNDDNEEIKFLVNSLKEHDKTFRRDKRIFEYKATIISLYGLLEKYIETWIKEYLDFISNLVPDYNLIDEKVRSNHFELSLKLINTITSRESAKYQRITKEEVLQKLNSCIVTPNNYQINTEAFVLLSGNLKHNKIVDLFKYLNIDLNQELVNNEQLNNEIGLSKERIANVAKETLYIKINELVERRNVIAHGSTIENENLLGISELEPYIQFLEIYCQAIFEVLSEKIIKYESIYRFQKIEKVIKVINNQILAFEIEKYLIKVGDSLIIETQKGNYFKKTILSIQLNNQSHQELLILEKTNIAISIDFNIKDNQTFYLLKK